jgi:hypothetical protein
LLIGCEDGDGVAHITAHLIAHLLHLGWWRADEPATPTAWTRRVAGGRSSGGSSRVHARHHRLATHVGTARDARESNDLRIGQGQLARVRKQEVGGCAYGIGATSSRPARHRARPRATARSRRRLCANGGRRSHEQHHAKCASDGLHEVLPWM